MLVDGPTGATVEGVAYEVATRGHAQRLAEYETGNYRVRPGVVRYKDGGEPAREGGWVFVFGGEGRELCEGGFDLGVWLGRMGRGGEGGGG